MKKILLALALFLTGILIGLFIIYLTDKKVGKSDRDRIICLLRQDHFSYYSTTDHQIDVGDVYIAKRSGMIESYYVYDYGYIYPWQEVSKVVDSVFATYPIIIHEKHEREKRVLPDCKQLKFDVDALIADSGK